jgi:hypothetical protein
VEKHKKNVKPIQIMTFITKGDLQSTHSQGESAAQAWNTAGPWWLYAGLFNPGVAGAGEICIPCTRILTPLGQLRCHNSGSVQVCDEYHR